MSFRPILIALAILGCIAIPLALAIWRLQSRKRPRHLRIPFSDHQALILQVKQLLSRVGFTQGPTIGQAILFQPSGPQKLFGMTPIELLFDRPSAARLTATHGIMRRISRNFPGATDELYSGPTLLPWKGLVTAFVLLLGMMAILLGFFAFTHRRGLPGASVIAAQNLDVEQTVNVSAAQIRSGTFIAVTVAHTGESIQVHIPTKAKEGTKLRLRGKGRANPQGGTSGDLYLLIHIIS